MKKWYSNSTLRKICDGQKFKSILPDMRKIEDKNIKVNMHQRRGRLIEVYDGRSWPVVKSGNVYVAPDDSVENVKSTILSASATQGKKSSKKNSKHALAIGTSFGHVHAFLKDSDSLLQEIEKNRAQDKCLMLIKKPKSSSKQMLKAQSWANLSVSDSHLYQQLDGGYHTDHRRHPKYRTKRKQSDLQLLAETEAGFRPLSSETSRSESLSDKQRLREEDVRRKIKNEERLQKPDNKLQMSESKREYQYIRKDEENMYPQTQKNWTGKQTSSNQCLSEINNNKKLSNGNRMYSSHNDIYMQFPQSSAGYRSSKDINSGAIKSDEFYSNNICDIQEESANDQDPVSRSQSVGDLTTGLTLSLVGQRKSESIQCLSAAHAPPKPPRLFQNSVKTYSPVPQKYSNNRNTQRPHSDLTNQNSSSSNGNTKTQKQRKSLVNLNTLTENHVLIEDDSLSEFSVRSEQGPSKTPNKQRRTLPCIPSGDLNEKKRQYAEIVKMRMSAQSRSSVSSSRQSQFTPQSADISRSTRTDETSSDREVSDLFVSPKGSGNNSVDVHDSSGMCNKKGYDSNVQDKNMNKMSSGYYSANQGNVITSLPSSVRSCDSGQTTLTSLSSTVDSGYMTNDQDVDMYSSSSYTRSLQKSAQNLYHNNKLQVYSYGNGSRRDSQSDKPAHTNVNNRRESTGDYYRNNSKRSERHSTGTYNYDEIHPHYSKTSYVSKENASNNNTMPNRTSASKIKENPSVQNLTSPTILKNGNRIVNGANSGNGAKKPVASVFRRISDLELSSNWDHGNGQKSNYYQGQGHYEEEVTDFTSKKVKGQNFNENNVVPVHDKPLHQDIKVVNKQFPRKESPDDSVVSEELQYSTLPGNWRYHGNKNEESSPNAKKPPCLYQILQTHDLLPLRINLDETCLFVDIAKLRESQISLPLVKRNIKQESPVVSTPKGKYANLGGPGSAFKPVKTVTANVSLVTMVTIDEILKTNVKSSNLEKLQKGDILVEVNEQLVMGGTLSTVQEQLQNLPGEILLTIARLKPTQNTPQNNDKNQNLTVEELKREMALLQAEVKLKDKKIQELNSMLPWKQNVEEVVKKIEINGNCYPRELLPGGLGEDEYIV